MTEPKYEAKNLKAFLLRERTRTFTDLRKEMISIILNDDLDFETMTDKAQTLIAEKRIKLTNAEIVSFADTLFNHGLKTQERLTISDKFYQELDHANSMIVENGESTIGLFYQ
jgi:hypothetical protein